MFDEYFLLRQEGKLSRVEAESPNQVDGYVGNMTMGNQLITPSA